MWEELHKFNLDHCDLPTMLWNVAVGLRVLTLNIENKYNRGIPFYYYLITYLTAACYYYVFLISMLWFVIVRFQETNDLIATMVVLSLGISSEIGPVKLIFMFINADKIREIADDYLKFDALAVPATRFYSNLQKSLRKIKKRAIIYWMVIVGNGILYLSKPIVMSGRNLPENYFVIYGLEPMFESPNYEIAYILMAGAVYFTCYVPACVTAYLIIIAGYTESQMLALSEEMRHIWTDATKHTKAKLNITKIKAKSSIEINKFVRKRLKEIIIHHAQMIKLFHNVEHVFRGPISMGFLILILGLIAELLGKLENTYLQMPFAFMQVGMDCFAGQRLMDASVMFEQAVYDCQWENFDKANMKMVQIMVRNSQKTMSLSAGGIATLSFSSLMSILRGIQSAYTALRSTMK